VKQRCVAHNGTIITQRFGFVKNYFRIFRIIFQKYFHKTLDKSNWMCYNHIVSQRQQVFVMASRSLPRLHHINIVLFFVCPQT
jgi:hypothetical protein